MKASNYVLFFITTLAAALAVSMSAAILPKNGNSVIHVPAGDVAGQGLTFKLPSSLTPRQTELLGMAYSIAKKDGHKHPQLLQGIILQESGAGEVTSYKVAGQEFGLRANERYYGVAQIKLAAARDVLARNPDMISEYKFHTKTDEEVIAKLIENDKFNIAVASKYLLMLTSFGYNGIMQLALAYNQGPAGAKQFNPDTHHYSRGVMSYVQKLSPKNDKN
jgi:hypothetical protein